MNSSSTPIKELTYKAVHGNVFERRKKYMYNSTFEKLEILLNKYKTRCN